MRKIIYSMLISLDGYVESPNGDIGWTAPDEEVHAFINDMSREIGGSLYGRRLYENMSAYWPTADQRPDAPAIEVDFARIWRAMPKYVFSKTLDKVDWNSTLMTGDLEEEVIRLKREDGGDLDVGGATLAWSVLRLGLVDEFRIFIHPLVVGAGKPFFPQLDSSIRTRLLETRAFPSGIVYLRYEVT
ncbi:dihydrofolate reductase family protein [Nonomuraea sp. K274]|uniref:Dihydrofolate reductase family protein n=1 Tax=Nonomuraea cypriaca TaxID=1187855 RepID=A0A931AGN0_9ACTN|nr:dihydrofolate reductase family protein [Nonomuraea cypriaca]MBF8190143.1 dihydrofolate reductase family protein [Nonomuraea cypriaca]